MDIWDILEQGEHWLDPAHMFCVSGVMLFAAWLLKTSLGRRALVVAPVRRNNMSFHIPLIAFLVWQAPIYLLGMAVDSMIKDWPPWQQDLMDYMIMIVVWTFAIIIFLVLASMSFARGLKGYGLRSQGIFRDIGAACVYLFSIWPLVMAMVIMVNKVGQWSVGPDYEMQQHMALENLVSNNQWPLRLSIVLSAVVIAPLVEEMLFRGFIQSLFRSVLNRPWVAIFCASTFFSAAHANAEHWPALFILSLGIGYAYEKSGSLWRPIFMHVLFNGITVFSFLISP